MVFYGKHLKQPTLLRMLAHRAQEENMAKSVLTVSKPERLDADCDKDGDVPYISFWPPVAASDSRVLENDVVVRY